MILSTAVVLLCASVATTAQWLHHPTAGVPRTADGKPNLKAPPPRLADGKPDFSGIWQVADKIPCSKEVFKFVDCGLEIGGSLLALNIGSGMPGGLPYQPWAAALMTQRSADNSKDDPHARSQPHNPPRSAARPHKTNAEHAPP